MKSLYSWLHGKGLSTYRRFCDKWWKEVLTLENPRDKFEDALERARYGVSRRDVWSFDSYLARVAINGLTELRDRGHGAPCIDREWLDCEDLENDWTTHPDLFILWASILTAMIDGFEAHLMLQDMPWLSNAPDCTFPSKKSDKGSIWDTENDPFIAWLDEHREEHRFIESQLEERKQLGLELFTEYFGALWD